MKNPLPTQKKAWFPPRSADTYSAFLSRAWGKVAAYAKKREIRARSASRLTLDRVLLPGVRSRWALPLARTYTPEAIEGILREALTSSSPRREQELYTLMLQTWPRLAKNMAEIKNAVIGLEWNLVHPDDLPPDEAAADLARRARLHMRGDPIEGSLGWEGTLRHLLDGWFRGVSLVEIDWEASAGAILPRQTRPIPPWHYGWTGPEGRLVLYPEALAHGQSIEIPREKFLIAIHNTSGSHPSGGALLRPLAFWWCAANFSAEWFLNFAQIFGQPFRWATYDRSDADAATTLAEIMENMGSSAWGVGPEGTQIEFHDAAKGAGDNPQLALLDRADTACDILLLGQTLTTEVGDSGSRALGTVHQSVRADIIDAASGWLAEILNEQFLPALILLNRGTLPDPGTLPWWEASRKQSTDTKLLAETIEILTRAGLPIPKAWAYASLDIPEPADGEPVIEPPTPDLAPALAQMPVEARAYVLSHLQGKR
jgi:phage gp29-like protein